MATIWTATHVATLKEALASGELSVEYNGKAVRYRSVAEQLYALAVMERAIEADATTDPVPKQVRMVQKTKGY